MNTESLSTVPSSIELVAGTGGHKRRTGKRPPCFLPDQSKQLDPFHGCPDFQVPQNHLARSVLKWVTELDTRSLVEKGSALGRRGYDPCGKLAVWLYASLIGVHHASKLAERMKTDAAFLLLSGGYRYSATTLREFRRDHGDFFEAAVLQTVSLAHERGLVDPCQGAVDSMRLRAHASTASIRTRERSEKRLQHLQAADLSKMSEDERKVHAAKVAKHSHAVKHCTKEQRSNFSTTNELAGLLKFPHGGALPGHRISVTAVGVQLRLIVVVLVTSAGHDYGHLEQLARKAREQFLSLGLPETMVLQIAADAGYLCSEDLQFALNNRNWVDVLIHESSKMKASSESKYYGREQFVIHEDGRAFCPAGTEMKGPKPIAEGRRQWTGVGCGDCELKSHCTEGQLRRLTQDPELDKARDAMRKRMEEPGAKERYNKRIATVEPVFSGLEEMMGYRRASSRFAKTVRAEILLKVLAYNLSRIAAARTGYFSLLMTYYTVLLEGDQLRILNAWAPFDENTTSAPHDEKGASHGQIHFIGAMIPQDLRTLFALG